jgi:dCTP deaminase
MKDQSSLGANSDALGGAVLSKEALRQRLKKDLIVSPILDDSQIGDGSIDISLGTRFITSRRSKLSQIDFPKLDLKEMQSFQESVVVPIGLPNDICGFVLSRSSYGRAGLLIATATFVHPCWRGCLTLELENLGEIPIILRPLSTVGQLVLLNAAALPSKPKAKSIPVAPTFTTLNQDPRWKKIEALEKP